jgi:hypothetical protein
MNTDFHAAFICFVLLLYGMDPDDVQQGTHTTEEMMSCGRPSKVAFLLNQRISTSSERNARYALRLVDTSSGTRIVGMCATYRKGAG